MTTTSRATNDAAAPAATDAFAARLAQSAQDVETALETLLSPATLDGEIARPPRLLAAMRYASLAGGKRLRPFLLIESARLFGCEGEGPLRAACALEMVHCYSLAHDDLPAMDDDDLRRGRPTTHKAFDEATAILAGDALLTYAFDVMADERTHADARVRADLTLGLARAAGLGGMAGGQMFDLEAENATTPLTRGEIERLQAMKTGALLRFGAEAGAVIAQAPDDARAALVRYGRALGAAFQIADDILDAQGDAATLGKATGKDAGRNKGTLVALMGVEAARALCETLAREAQQALAPFGGRAAILAAAAAFTIRRDR